MPACFLCKSRNRQKLPDWRTEPRLGREPMPDRQDACPGHSVFVPFLQTEADLIGPEALQARQGLVDQFEFIGRHAANLLDRKDVLVIQTGNDVVHFLADVGQADANRTAIE